MSGVTGPFPYHESFSRNIGWVTEAEQETLRHARVAIGGLGGVGFSHALTLARFGVGKFTISDLDTFDWPNMNRQAGAFVSTIGRPKLDVAAETLRDINPEIELHEMPGGINDGNIDEFLRGASLYMDSLDIFALNLRRKVFARCRELGIPAVTAAPMGMGTAFLAFTPDSMSFEDYFALDGYSFEDQVLKFIVGVSPAMLQRHYLLNRGTVNLFKRKVPSTCAGIELAAGVAATNGVKLILGRGGVRTAPRGLHFDAYLNKMVKTWRPGGNRNPMQRLMFWYIRRLLNPTSQP
ncbi:ThiF family adenylyltransferase [Roseateles sp. MS654]|uniref:ThiF family adenylyltransferase n=1 Tax=Roseateles sp. MS654 TaxID=3412685 RepID=UPI003C2CDF58